MDNVTFREAPTPPVEQPSVNLPEPEADNKHAVSGESDIEPIEIREAHGRSVVLDALGIEENVDSLPEEDKGNLENVKQYVMEIVKSKGLSPTVSSFKKTLDSVKEEMGLDKEAEPSIVLDRISGVVRAWHNLSFISDSGEKKQIFMKLAHLKTSQEMNREVFKLMEERKVWL